jgi:hypothetical protein
MAPDKPEREILYFNCLKEDRGSYFVEYKPPVSRNAFATLTLTYSKKCDRNSVGRSMATEVDHWLKRYPVPIMTSAWDTAENRITPLDDGDGFLFGWIDPVTATITHSWTTNELPSFFNELNSVPDWRNVYEDVPFRTDSEVKASANQNWARLRKQNLTLKIILGFWLSAIPAVWAIVQYLGPQWLAFAVLLYSLSQAFRTARKLFWRVEPTDSDKVKAERKLKMDHYFYHCEQNPNGFVRLKAENFGRETIERNINESEALRKRDSESK